MGDKKRKPQGRTVPLRPMVPEPTPKSPDGVRIIRTSGGREVKVNTAGLEYGNADPDTLRIVVTLTSKEKVVRRVVRTFKRDKHLSLEKMVGIEAALMRYPAAEDDE